MIPKLTLDKRSINKNWKDKEDRNWVKKFCEEVGLCIDTQNRIYKKPISIYKCDSNWVELGVFKEFKKAERLPIDYGYCDREEDLEKYLKSYVEDKNNNFLVCFGFMNMDYEKYYKNGSYIDKDGNNTKEDYYYWINEHQEDKNRQQFPNKWISFAIFKLIK